MFEPPTEIDITEIQEWPILKYDCNEDSEQFLDKAENKRKAEIMDENMDGGDKY